MNVEFEEFDSIEDIFLYMSSIAPPMKNYLPINSYKGYICSIIPLSQSGSETYLMIYTKGSLENGILEFDINTKNYKKVESIERADKTYFIVLSPKRNTIADAAIKKL
ncbi:hypothetical protein AAA799D07_00252 [Marine Group I thaumarchaeote SCGC AAA799-D07]|jgi:hypothetical protein|nr:hypothetical protein AAA799D07_00252 [Marine Group I thaumarchaeote SCGC AAA799-D07]